MYVNRVLSVALAVGLAAPATASTHHKPTSHKTAHSAAASHSSRASTSRAQSRTHTSHGRSSHTLHGTRTSSHASAAPAAVQHIEPERATAIQQALIKNGYMSGEPSGQWDSASIDAMKKYQADNGWPTRNAPDSRALIKLGLGSSGQAPQSQP